jgi:hypothetical protein
MDPITLSILMGAGQAILPAIKSIQQGSRLKNLPDIERPDFQIPEAAKEQLGLARTIASNRNMPGYDEALDKIENQTNRAIGDVKAAGGNMQDIMAAMASANVGAGMAKRDLDITNAKSYLGSLQNLQGQLGSYANWQNAQQQDQMKAYNDEMARRASLDTARQQNMQNAVGSVGQGVATGLGYQMNMNLMNKMYPGATPPSTTPEGPMKGIDISALPMPAAAPVNIQPQNLGPIAGQQPDLQGIVSSLQGFGVIPGTPTATTAPNVNQIQGSLQGQMGSDFASVNGPITPNSTVPTTALGVTRPDLLPENRVASLDMSMQPGSGVLAPGLDPNVIAANGGAGVLAPQFIGGQPSQSQPNISGVLAPQDNISGLNNNQISERNLNNSLDALPPGTIISDSSGAFYYKDASGKLYGAATEAELEKHRNSLMPTYKK